MSVVAWGLLSKLFWSGSLTRRGNILVAYYAILERGNNEWRGNDVTVLCSLAELDGVREQGDWRGLDTANGRGKWRDRKC